MPDRRPTVAPLPDRSGTGARPGSSAEQRGLAADRGAAVLNPTPQVLARWNGALQTRLNRMPIEAFLRAHRQACAYRGEAALNENLAAVLHFIIDPALPHRGRGWRALLDPRYFTALGIVTGNLSLALTGLIGETPTWRTAALSGTARLLASQMGIDSAAQAAAGAVRDFDAAGRPALLGGALDELVVAAVDSCEEEHLDVLRALLAGALAPYAAMNRAHASLSLSITRIAVVPAANQ